MTTPHRRSNLASLARCLAAATAIALAAASSSGCGALVAGGAGAAGAIYLTSRGVESQVNASISEAYDASLAELRDRGIRIESTKLEDGGDKRDIDGQLGDLDVDVHLERVESGLTEIVVKAHSEPLGRDNDYARDLLSDIVDRIDRGGLVGQVGMADR